MLNDKKSSRCRRCCCFRSWLRPQPRAKWETSEWRSRARKYREINLTELWCCFEVFGWKVFNRLRTFCLCCVIEAGRGGGFRLFLTSHIEICPQIAERMERIKTPCQRRNLPLLFLLVNFDFYIPGSLYESFTLPPLGFTCSSSPIVNCTSVCLTLCGRNSNLREVNIETIKARQFSPGCIVQNTESPARRCFSFIIHFVLSVAFKAVHTQ